MTNKNQDKRTLAYKRACIVTNEELSQIAGGTTTGTTKFTTKQTGDTRGNLDAGGDVRWD